MTDHTPSPEYPTPGDLPSAMPDGLTGSHDKLFKNLFLDFPMDTVRWLLPDAEASYGKLVEIVPLRQEPTSQNLDDRRRILDLPMRCRFERGEMIIALIEHQSSRDKFSIYKLAHYTLDMMEANPGIAVIPIVVFADSARTWHKHPPTELTSTALGIPWLQFTYKLERLKARRARDMLATDNPVLHILIANFDYDPREKVDLLYQAFAKLAPEIGERKLIKYVDFVETYAKLTDDELKQLMHSLEADSKTMTIRQIYEERGIAKGITTGIAKGRQEGRQEGRKEGRQEVLIRMIQMGERALRRPQTPADDLINLPVDDLETRAAQLEQELSR